MPRLRRSALRLAAAAVATTLAFGPAGPAAAAWPEDRPIEVIVPFPPAGGVDAMVRAAVHHAAQHLPGARFVVTNRPGAAGQVGFEAIFSAAPDGYTLGAVTNTALNGIAIERRPRYQVERFSYIANIVDDPGGFWVAADSRLRTLRDLQEAARREPDALAVGTAGIGSDDHLLQLAFEAAASVRLLHVPYPGTAPIITELLGGRLAVGSLNMSEGLSLMRDGKIRALGQAGPERWPPAGEVPTFVEQGFDVTGGSARGIAGPPGLPPAILTRLVEAFAATLADPAFQAEAARLNLPLRPLSGDAYRDMMLANHAALRELWQRRPWKDQ
jgi:tripartite-type tricarboxylate transporter receptor subunit TctC